MTDRDYLRLAFCLARRGRGATSPNPMVGAVLVKADEIIGRGWHRRAGEPHAEIEALRDAEKNGNRARGATLYVTLEPCCTHGRTPPCTEAILRAGIKRVVAGATDPNPRHCGKGFARLEAGGIAVTTGVLAEACERLNEAFNHWIVRRTPFVTVKAAMTLDGKIATASGQSKWITGEQARAYGMTLRGASDAILAGINTVLADDPSLTFREREPARTPRDPGASKRLRRIVLDAQARTPVQAKVVTDAFAALTTIFVSRSAPADRVKQLASHVRVVRAPARSGKLDLPWIMKLLGTENVTNLLVEGGGEVNASFLMQGLAQRIAFFYAPKILGGLDSRRAVAGEGARSLAESLQLRELKWRRLGPDLLLEAAPRSKLLAPPAPHPATCTRMFTGIVEETGIIEKIAPGAKSIQLTVRANLCGRGLKKGASLAVNGCCLTAVKLLTKGKFKLVQFDLLKETWNRTNLQFAKPGSLVNLERPLRSDGNLGGHFVTGHIDGVGTITRWERMGKDHVLDISAPPEVMRYLVSKGSIAVDGISLTVAGVEKKGFRIWIIPHTYEITALRERRTGDAVNLEADLIGKYVEKFVSARST